VIAKALFLATLSIISNYKDAEDLAAKKRKKKGRKGKRRIWKRYSTTNQGVLHITTTASRSRGEKREWPDKLRSICIDFVSPI